MGKIQGRAGYLDVIFWECTIDCSANLGDMASDVMITEVWDYGVSCYDACRRRVSSAFGALVKRNRSKRV